MTKFCLPPQKKKKNHLEGKPNHDVKTFQPAASGLMIPVLLWLSKRAQLAIFQWKGEIQEFCPNTKMLLVGCKSDLRTDVSTLVELSNHRQTPVSYDQVGKNPFFLSLLTNFAPSSAA